MPALHIMVVDDDPHVRGALCRALDQYRVTEAEHGMQALTLIHDGLRPDLILTDLEMPVLSGDALCVIMQRDMTIPKIPTVIMSGNPDVQYVADAVGITMVLQKPFDMDDLHEMISAALV